jgi:hypothetical protein
VSWWVGFICVFVSGNLLSNWKRDCMYHSFTAVMYVEVFWCMGVYVAVI